MTSGGVAGSGCADSDVRLLEMDADVKTRTEKKGRKGKNGKDGPYSSRHVRIAAAVAEKAAVASAAAPKKPG